MSDKNKALERLRADYESVTGKPFNHFFCPILRVDEETELCDGHIVNKSIPDSSNKTVLQRKDVDNFYGILESELVELYRMKQKTSLADHLKEKNASKSSRPRILSDGKELPYYLLRGRNKSPYPGRSVCSEDSTGVEIVIKMDAKELEEVEKSELQFEVFKDYSYPVIASVIKAAYLTMFYLHGYRYVTSVLGLCVGDHILGEFYRKNVEKDAGEIKREAKKFFYKYRNMVRPLVEESSKETKGTINDDTISVVFGTSGQHFAMIVSTKIGDEAHAVLLPSSTEPDQMAQYLKFLETPPETFVSKLAVFDREKMAYESDPGKPIRGRWHSV